MGISLDLRKAHHSRIHGDIVAVQTWVNEQRALVLISRHRRDAGWYILDESAAWKWNLNAIDPVERNQALRHADAQSRICCDLFGIEPTARNRARLINIVVDTIPELVRMPTAPEPEYMKAAIGQMQLRADGKVVAGEDMRLQDQGVAYA